MQIRDFPGTKNAAHKFWPIYRGMEQITETEFLGGGKEGGKPGEWTRPTIRPDLCAGNTRWEVGVRYICIGISASLNRSIHPKIAKW